MPTATPLGQRTRGISLTWTFLRKLSGYKMHAILNRIRVPGLLYDAGAVPQETHSAGTCQPPVRRAMGLYDSTVG